MCVCVCVCVCSWICLLPPRTHAQFLLCCIPASAHAHAHTHAHTFLHARVQRHPHTHRYIDVNCISNECDTWIKALTVPSLPSSDAFSNALPCSSTDKPCSLHLSTCIWDKPHTLNIPPKFSTLTCPICLSSNFLVGVHYVHLFATFDWSITCADFLKMSVNHSTTKPRAFVTQRVNFWKPSPVVLYGIFGSEVTMWECLALCLAQ
jgi:hypothetical protein